MSYFNTQLVGRNLRDAVSAAEQTLTTFEFDAIVCRGNSGLLFAAPLGMMMDKQILIVRKATDNSHSSNIVEGNADNVKRLLIVDDFISSGSTVKEIYSKVKLALPDREIVGVYLYSRDYENYKINLARTYEDSEREYYVPIITAGKAIPENLDNCYSY